MIRTSAPNKVHLCGEHSVVYGGWAILTPIVVEGKRNTITLNIEDGEPCFEFQGDLGTAILAADGKKTGDEIYLPILETASFVLGKTGIKIGKIIASLQYGGSPKGTGNSASIPTALALALYTAFKIKPSKKELYEAAFAADNAYHGMKSSGGDVQGVISNCPQKFRKIFAADGTITTQYSNVKASLPKGSSLVLVDSYRGGTKASTAEMVAKFAAAHSNAKKPAELSAEERRALTAPFDFIVERDEAQLREDGDAQQLGEIFNENHALLQSVSSKDIEDAIHVGKKNGALGGKLIGAGGEGGSLLLLCFDDDIVKIVSSLKESGFKAWNISFDTQGPKIEQAD